MTIILGQHASHDSSACVVTDGQLHSFVEHSKLGRPKYERFDLGSSHVIGRTLNQIPDIWAFSCFHERHGLAVGYFGVEGKHAVIRERQIFGKVCTEVHITHELGHIWSAVALSPYKKCIVVVAEGTLSSVYRFDNGEIAKIADLPAGIGARYQALYTVGTNDYIRMAAGSGKLMAKIAMADTTVLTSGQKQTIDAFLDWQPNDIASLRTNTAVSWLKRWLLPEDIPGFSTDWYLAACKYFSEQTLTRLLSLLESVNTEDLPVVMSGGCGLNCDWNTAIANAFETFIPPCPDDSGQSIGAAAYANWLSSGRIQLDYAMFCGLPVFDATEKYAGGRPLNLEFLASRIVYGDAVAWMEGNYCIGPRALGDRSILMSAYGNDTQSRMNAIKKREAFRPVAPSVLEEDADKCFEPFRHVGNVYMQFFQKVRDSRLTGITHVDGTARAQYVNSFTAPPNYIALLHELKRLQGVGIVANSSLNMPGTGMMHKVRDALEFCKNNGIPYLVVNDTYYTIE